MLNTGVKFHDLLASETANCVVMKLADGTKKTVLRNQIEEQRSQNLSFTPKGLERVIDHQPMAELIAVVGTPMTIPK